MSMDKAGEEVKKAIGAVGEGVTSAAVEAARGITDGIVGMPKAAADAAQHNMFGGADNPLGFFFGGLLGGAQKAVEGTVSGAINSATSLLKSVPKVAGHTAKATYHAGNSVLGTLASPTMPAAEKKSDRIDLET